MTLFQLKHILIQLVRRGVQVSAVSLVTILAFLGLYHHYYHARQLDQIAAIPGWRGEVLQQVSTCLDAVEDPAAFLARNNGNLWSLRVAGIEITDPLAFAEASAASRAVYLPLLLAALIPVIVAVLLGRVFCSWICPGYLVFEITGKLRRVLARGGLRPATVQFSHRNKYLLLGVGLAAAAATSLPIFSLFYPPALLSRVAHALIFGTGLAGMLSIIGLIVVFEVFVSPRWWCRSMCPGGALYGLLGWRRALRVTCDMDLCTPCGKCDPVCEAGIHPATDSRGLECDNCGVCIRHCPEGALGFSLSLSGHTPARERAGRDAGALTATRSP